MHRRSFLIGSLAVGISSTLPFKALALAKRPFEDDMADIIKAVLPKYETDVERLSDLMHIFEAEVEKYMKDVWHTWKPLEQMKLMGVKGDDGVMDYSKWTYIKNMWNDPNFFDQMHCAGGWTSPDGHFYDSTGFYTAFNHPDGEQIVKVRFHWSDKKVDIKYEPRISRQPNSNDAVPTV